MMFNEYDHIVLFGFFDQVLVVRQKLSCWLGNEDMNAPLNGIERNRVMCAC